MTAIIPMLKENDQDFEWYPTTTEILQTVKKDMTYHFGNHHGEINGASVLDCGAGDGRALEFLSGAGGMYAIEKSKILLNEMPADVFMVGTDFEHTTLIDKKTDVVFCNPPYSEFEQWAAKIIREANAAMIYLVIPERWENSEPIKHALETREAEAKTIGSFDFLKAERKARAKVNILSIQLYSKKSYNREQEPTTDPFAIWFDNQFFPKADKTEAMDETKKAQTFQERIESKLVEGRGVIPVLVELYNHEMATLQKNYAAVAELNPDILEELGVDTHSLQGALKQKIEGLKNKYWQELFDNYQSITSRLTKHSRETMLKRLCKHMSVDFTESNIYAVTIWAIKNANKYYDAQLIQLVEGMIGAANITLYKSNQRTFEKEDWYYCRQPEGLDRYALELRIVLSNTGKIKGTDEYGWEFHNNLSNRGHEFLADIAAIANNLGWFSFDDSRWFDWESNKKQDFRSDNSLLMSVKAFKNGNMHLKFNQDFIKKLNIEFGRLKGWLKNKQEASEELNIPVEEIAEFFNTNYRLTSANVPLLCE